MDLIIDEVVELEEVDPADRDVVIEFLTGAAVIELALAVLTQAGLDERLADCFLAPWKTGVATFQPSACAA